MALNKTYLNKLKKSLHTYHLLRRSVIDVSNNALHHAKRAIFSMHRGDLMEASKKIAAAEKLLLGLEKKSKKQPKVVNEGAFKAAVEEYVEAVVFYSFIKTGKMGPVKGLHVEPDVYLAGLCDVPGELYRYAIRAASEKDFKMVKKCNDAASEVIGMLIEFDLTSYLRNKFDQAKQAAHKLEFVVYETSLRE